MTAYLYLTDEEKKDIITSHIRGHEYNLYNVEISRLEEAASPTPVQSKLDLYDLQSDEYKAKIAALIAEKDKLQ